MELPRSLSRVRISALTPDQRRLVQALVDAQREAHAASGANERTARASETPRAVQEVRRADRRSSPAA